MKTLSFLCLNFPSTSSSQTTLSLGFPFLSQNFFVFLGITWGYVGMKFAGGFHAGIDAVPAIALLGCLDFAAGWNRMGMCNQGGWPPWCPVKNGVVGILFYEWCSRVTYCYENRTGLLEQRAVGWKIEIGRFVLGELDGMERGDSP